MALRKSVDCDTGIAAEYWRISRVELYPKNMVTADIECYLNKVARDASKNPVIKMTFTFKHSALIDVDIVAWCYNKIKLLDFFTGSEDV